jgi:membrane-bound metal-dependent hydrolase YbcI (DUF457 family)
VASAGARARAPPSKYMEFLSGGLAGVILEPHTDCMPTFGEVQLQMLWPFLSDLVAALRVICRFLMGIFTCFMQG